MKKYFLFILLPLLLNSCKNNSEVSVEANEKITGTETIAKRYKKIEQLEWLIGTWTNESGEEFSQETWSKENDSTFTAFSFTQIEGKTVFAETMALEQKDQRLLLTVATANEKGSSPVTFTFISSDKKQFTFENKSHDFPQRITYTNPAKDSLHAWIEGKVNNENKKVEFHFSGKN